jgi:peptide deformylase
VEHEDDGPSPQHIAFIAELRHWREVSGHSQKSLAKLVGYDASYLSKVESGTVLPSREFVVSADQHMRAGRAIIRVWQALQQAAAKPPAQRHGDVAPVDVTAAVVNALIVEHEHSELVLNDGVFRSLVRRQLRNVGTEPVSRYLVRIAVDRYPGDPKRSNQLYRADPLTWEEISLAARCGDEPMTWVARYDRDAFKEIWLLFENRDGRFPLYPGEVRWIEYTYSVSEMKWGPWWQRAIRVPTRRISLVFDVPTELDPVVWGLETSMTAELSAFRSPISRQDDAGRSVFNWSANDPPLHTRYRVEWRFKADRPNEEEPGVDVTTPSERMRDVGVVQEGAEILTEVARPFDLPRESEDALRVVAQLHSAIERVSQVHQFSKGMGIAAPQIGIGRAAALVRTPAGETFTLLNPRVIDESTDTEEFYEGCLSFFDVRGLVPRPTVIEVEHQDVDGNLKITTYRGPVARLVGHEVDHLHGKLYRDRMRPNVMPISVAEYGGVGQPWRS